MKKKYLLAMPFLVCAGPALAHDFWIQPLDFQVGEGQPVAATFQVGHGDARQRWGSDARRIPVLIDVSASGRNSQRGNVRITSRADLVTRLRGAGVHILGMQTSPAYSNLPALRFNDYLKAEGLTVPIAVRARTRTSDTPGRERYSRRAKSLIEVGAQTAANSALATRPIGLKLEIVPERNPYTLGQTRKLPVHVLYNGKRLAGATIRLTSLESDAKPFQSERTDRAGRATFTVPRTGDWLLNVIWSEPLRGDPEADFDTTFSSLTFGYEPARRRR